jgi:cytochrome c
VDSSEWNKFAGWTLAALLLMMVLSTVSGSLFHHERQEKPAFVPDGCDGDRTCGAGDGSAPPAPEGPVVPLPNLLAAATAEKGEAIFKQCTTCHSIEKGGAAKTGPNLWGIVGNKHAHASGYAYSAGLAGKAGEMWTWEALNAWLTNPKKAIPGNKMSFGGISKPESRAALLMYLNKNSDAPMALPAPVAVEAAAAPTKDAKGAVVDAKAVVSEVAKK